MTQHIQINIFVKSKFEIIKLTHILQQIIISSIILFKEISLHGSTDEILVTFTPKNSYALHQNQ